MRGNFGHGWDQSQEHVSKLEHDYQILEHLKGVLVHFSDGAQVMNVTFPQHSPSEYGTKAHKAAGKVKAHTISCTWFNPSKIIYLHYLSRKWAEKASKRFDKSFRGRQVQARIHERKNAGQEREWLVRLSNVPVDTTDHHLREILKGVRAEKYVHGKRSTTLTEAESWSFVEDLFTDEENSFQFSTTSPSSTGAKAALFMELNNPAHARRALSWSGTYYEELGSKIYVEQIATVKFRVLPEVYALSIIQLHELRKKTEAGVYITMFGPKQHNKLAVIHIYGPQSHNVAKTKGRVESILAGTVILGDDNSHILWDEYLATIEGFAFLSGLSRPGKMFLYRDIRTRRLVFHGDAALLNGARLAILNELCRRKHSVHITLLEGELWSKVLRGGFKRLTNKFGKGKAKLNIGPNGRALIFSGSPEDFSKAKELLEADDAEPSATAPSPHSDAPGDSECPACLSDVEDALELACGHRYCRVCFEDQCKEADGRELKIVCYGNDGACGQTVSLDILRKILAHEKFQNLLSASLECYVRSHPGEFTYCPTPDCTTVYRITSDPGEIVCDTCLALICTKCGSVGHDGITCDVAREEAYRGSKEHREFLEMKKWNNIKDCPKCTTPIQKLDGCNHMVCAACKADICWVCLETFESDRACYGHLRAVHGRIGDNLIPQELLDDGWA
ncbi:hypothetical protein PV08_04694 [Exophiala spinifera]|uniref:RBR-type E3 ubiquitin transferase n=1 Tax=Exophiala spinifera TaxID=91928 RepID=A0A0D2BG02_9EURO|nr:uncharacterized protein PV08_04694 [Exophiala spinifera]KIW17500.1 hypothetical protein PV08_04694 [Exophiala spinifera]